MNEGTYIAEVAALFGDPARARILAAVRDKRELTATELAHAAGVAPQTASGHLAKLVHANLVSVEQQGRLRYYRIAHEDVARALDSLMALAVAGASRHLPMDERVDAIRFARTCYDHLAGRMGVTLGASLVDLGYLRATATGFDVTPRGEIALGDFGIDVRALRRGRRALARNCLDWSEHRPHLAGSLAAALLSRMRTLGWLTTSTASRAVRLTAAGREGLKHTFAVKLVSPAGPRRRTHC